MNTLLDLRDKINEIDMALLRLLKLRCLVSEEVRIIKEAENLPVFDPQREQVVLEKLNLLNSQSPSLLKKEDIEKIWGEIFNISKGIQNNDKENTSLPSSPLS